MIRERIPEDPLAATIADIENEQRDHPHINNVIALANAYELQDRHIDRYLNFGPKRTPVRKRRPGPPRRGRKLDPDYLEWIRTLPCCVCFAACYPSGEVWMLIEVGWEPSVMRGDGPGVQESRTEAAHIGPHGSSDRKADDRDTAPLCRDEHHQHGPESHHKLRSGFWQHHGIDWPTLKAALRERYERSTHS